jgi:hypothetical protein
MNEMQKYDLSGLDTIDVWCKLPEGTTLTLINGAIAEIIANPQDGGFVLARFMEHPQDPSKVGEEDYIFFNEVKEAAA